jgi:uncharacterized protein
MALSALELCSVEDGNCRNLFRVSPDVYFFNRDDKYIVFNKRNLKSLRIDFEAKSIIDALSNEGSFHPENVALDEIERAFVEELTHLGIIESLEQIRHLTEDDIPRISGPLQITSYRIVLTEACNLRCTYCFQEETTDRQKSMSSETMEQVIDHLLARHGPEDQINIHWFGGEPLLQFKLIRSAVERLSAALNQGRIGAISYDMTTNGGLVNEDVAAFLAKYAIRVLVSLDGGKLLHDRTRIDTNGRGSFATSVRGYETLQRHGVDVGVIVTSSFETGRELAQGISDLIDMFAPRRVHVNTPQPTDRGWEVDGAIFAQQLYKAAIECAQRGIELVGPQQKIRRALALSETQNLDCVAPNGGMAVSISPYGHMGHCIVSWNGASHSQRGSWDYDLAEAWKTSSYKTDTCRACPAETVCGGPCPLEAELIGLDKQRCAFYLTTLELILLE